MVGFQIKLGILGLLALGLIFGLPLLAHAADGDDFSTSADYYLNQQRFGVTEHTATSDDYEIQGEFGTPGVGDASSDDFLLNNGTIWRTGGSLSITIVDASYDPVVSPVVTFGDITVSFTSQTATGTLGSNTQRVYIENFDGADTSGYSVTIAATGGTGSVWDGPALTDYDFNELGGDTDNGAGDGDAFGGQLTIDAGAGSLTARTGYGSTTGISLNNTPTAFSEGSADSITLITASGSSDDYHAVYAKDIDLSQSVPASQPADTYTINMTLTIA